MRLDSLINRRGRALLHLVRDGAADCRGIAATEFAFIVPLMLVMFFGTVEFCSGIAVDRKVTLMARTLSDMTSQSTSVADADMTNFFSAAYSIMYPYDKAPVNATITELYVDPTTHQARAQWSKGYKPIADKTVVPIPTALLVDGTYLIYSKVVYLYKPTIGYVMAQAGVNLSDVAYTRPRQSTCIFYSPDTACTTK